MVARHFCCFVINGDVTGPVLFHPLLRSVTPVEVKTGPGPHHAHASGLSDGGLRNTLDTGHTVHESRFIMKLLKQLEQSLCAQVRCGSDICSLDPGGGAFPNSRSMGGNVPPPSPP